MQKLAALLLLVSAAPASTFLPSRSPPAPLRSLKPVLSPFPSLASHPISAQDSAQPHHIGKNPATLVSSRRQRGWRTCMASSQDLESSERRPALPVLTGPVGGRPLLPGAFVVLPSLSPGQIAAIRTATAFAAMDQRLGGKPLVAYYGGSGENSYVKGVASLAYVQEIVPDEEGGIQSVRLLGVARAKIPRVRTVRDKPLLVADRWELLQDSVPESSYMHTLEFLRDVADDSAVEHNRRRKLMSAISSLTLELQLCDIDGTCDTEALLELGPEVYALAMELAATTLKEMPRSPKRSSGAGSSQSLQSLESMTLNMVNLLKPWDAMWPQWGDEIDGEVRLLRCFSFVAWQTLEKLSTKEELEWVMTSTDIKERMMRANAKLFADRKSLESTRQIMQRLKQGISSKGGDLLSD